MAGQGKASTIILFLYYYSALARKQFTISVMGNIRNWWLSTYTNANTNTHTDTDTNTNTNSNSDMDTKIWVISEMEFTIAQPKSTSAKPKIDLIFSGYEQMGHYQ